AFGRFLFDIDSGNNTALILAVLSSYQLATSNPCLNLGDFLSRPKSFIPSAWINYLDDVDNPNDNIFDFLGIDNKLLINNLLQSDYIGLANDNKPLVLANNNLY